MISVCIATYQGAGVLAEQLGSILPQLSSGDEVVISDDHSSDATLEVVRSFHSPLVRIVEGPCKGSPIPNFENALRHAKGDIVFLSDQDDKWTSDKVEVMVRALETSDCVVSDCVVTNAEMEPTASSFYEINSTRTGFLYNLVRKNGYLGCCMAFRRNVLEDALPFPKNIPMHDIWIGNVAACFHTVSFIPEKLIYFRRHGSNASHTAEKSRYSLGKKLLFRLRVVIYLFRRGRLLRKRRRTPSF